MSDTGVLRPGWRGLGPWLQHVFLTRYPPVFRALRAVWPVAHLEKFALVTRYDDVRQVFLQDECFGVPYADNLDLIMGGEKFFLGMGDTPEYRRDTAAMRDVVRAGDLPRLAAECAQAADRLLDQAGGRVEVVEYTRRITFDVLCRYFGISLPASGDLRVWATRLFEFQFTYAGRFGAGVTDPVYLDAARMAPLLRAHVDGLIAARRASGNGPDDVLGRALSRQADGGGEGFSDAKIRCALIGFLVGGLPQPPMVLPQALEQLLQRPDRLAEAQAAAHAGDTDTVARYMFEALRFDPLAPLLQRRVIAPAVLAPGTARETHLAAGGTVGVSFASAMRDPRRVADPESFRIDRPASDYLHFGHGLHSCFGEHINRVMLPAMFTALLQRDVRRAPGPEGELVKRGIFADTLWVEYAHAAPPAHLT